jgi:xanthine dehydrogenase/oxidase
MENQVAYCSPNEDGFDLYSSTQFTDFVQSAVAQVLGLKKSSSLNVKVMQLGGAYGGKITRANMTAAAAALASSRLNAKVRVTLGLNTSMQLVGKRFPWLAQYKVGFDKGGRLLGILINWYCNSGNSPSDNAMVVGYEFVDNVYNCANWHITSSLCKTNTPANTACRSPGTFPGIAIIESIMEHVANYLGTDTVGLRQANMYKKNQVTPYGQPLPYFNADAIVSELLTTSDYANRLSQIDAYNQQNRWKKKGISLTPIKWGAGWNGGYYNALVSIYASDGSVAVCHGGVECGQGKKQNKKNRFQHKDGLKD